MSRPDDPKMHEDVLRAGDALDGSGEHDALEALRGAWRALPRAEASPDGLPPESLALTDEATRVVVAELQRAWRTARVEAPAVPWNVRVAIARRLRVSRVRRVALAAAMSLFVGSASWALLERVSDSRSSAPRPNNSERGATRDGSLFAVATGDEAHVAVTTDPRRTSEGVDGRAGDSSSGPREVETTPLPGAPFARTLDIPRENVVLRDDGVEFESNGVRFVLIETTRTERAVPFDSED